MPFMIPAAPVVAGSVASTAAATAGLSAAAVGVAPIAGGLTNVILPAASAGLSFGQVAAIAGTALSAFGALSSGAAAQKQAQFNARQAQQEAQRRDQIATTEASDFRKRQAHVLARQRALMGASGLDPGSGTPLLVAGETAGEIELQARRILAGGQAEATRLRNQATLSRASGRAARTAGVLRGGALLLQGVGGFE